VARSRWRHGDEAVEARRGAMKHDQSRELKEGCWQEL
jgi:hypothetical protein